MSALCLLVAVICFVFAAFGKEPVDDLSIAWTGMVFFAVSFFPLGEWAGAYWRHRP